MGISNNTFITSVSTSTPSSTPLPNQDQEDRQEEGHSRNFDSTAMIKTPPLLDDDNNNNNDETIEITEDNDGFKTPTGIEHKIKVNLSCPPPAPTRPKEKTMKRRRSDLVRITRMLRFLDHVSDDDIQSLFTPRSVVRIRNNDHHDDNIRKLTNIRSFR